MSLTEDQLTAWFEGQRRLDTRRFPIGIGDDMAQVRLEVGDSVFVTTDMLLEGVHFDLASATLEHVGYKAMATSLSDCAAMATRPLAAVVSLGLPSGFTAESVKLLHAGLLRAADRYDCPLVGGDTTCWKDRMPLAINVAMLSGLAGRRPITRGGARVGDAVCVTGSLGGSLAGRHLEFEPRVHEAIALAGMADLHAMMDLSDGLASDLPRICRRSGVGAIVETGRLPLSQQACMSGDPVHSALCDGEDFELLFTLSEDDCRSLLAAWDRPPAITRIGTITATGKVQIRDAAGRTQDLKEHGYDHFSPRFSRGFGRAREK
jgi:thiamine-monophosphate kinase